MKEKFLPIGTVVILKEATKKIMITGYCSMTPEQENKLYDYSGCVFPEGLLSSDQVCLFDHNQIDRVFFEGFRNDEQKVFSEMLDSNYNRIVEAMNRVNDSK